MAFARIRNIANSIMNDGIYDNYPDPDYVKNGKKSLTVNKFLVYWPIVCYHLSAKVNAGNFRKYLKGTSQQILASMMESLGIKGYDKGGRIPTNQHGNPTVKKYVRHIN